MRKHSQHNKDERTQFFRKIYLSLYSKVLRKGYCVRGDLETEENYNILTPSSSGYSRVSFSFCWAAQPGTWGPSSMLGPGSFSLDCNNWLQTLISNKLELPFAPDYIIFCRPTASLSVASALNSTRPPSRLSSDISDRMHLLFTQVHFSSDSLPGSEVNMLHFWGYLNSK